MRGAYDYKSYIEKYGEFDLTGSYEYPIVAYAVYKYFVDNIDVKKTIEEHIGNYPYDGINDYLVAKKSGKQFKNLLVTKQSGKLKLEVLQQSVRYYISKTSSKLYKVKEKSDSELLNLVEKFEKNNRSVENAYVVTRDVRPKGKLIKVLEDGRKVFVFKRANSKSFKKEWYSYTDVAVDRNITIFNDYFESDDYNVDYNFYIEESKKLISAIKAPKYKKQLVKTTGKSLF